MLKSKTYLLRWIAVVIDSKLVYYFIAGWDIIAVYSKLHNAVHVALLDCIATFKSSIPKIVEWYLNNQLWIENILSGKYRGERIGLGGTQE